MIRGTGKAYHRAKQLRREMTLPEILLWQQLRKRQAGHKWRKQHAARDAWLFERGILTLRIPATEILQNMEGVITHIAHTATTRKPLHHPPSPGGLPPRDALGEE